MKKQVMIDEELFMQLIRYHLMGQLDESEEIEEQLKSKMNRMVSHEIYSKYKTESGEEKEKFRKEYLDSKHIHEDFRW